MRKTQRYNLKSRSIKGLIFFFLLTIFMVSLHPSKTYAEQNGRYVYTTGGTLEKYYSGGSLDKKPIIPPAIENDDGTFTIITAIGDECFRGNPTMEEIVLPETITSIGVRSFADNALLREITIPATITGVGDEAFQNSDIEHVTINADSSAFGNDIFKNCGNLTGVTFGSEANWQQIPTRMFYGCTRLGSITMPEGVSKIGAAAFCGSGIKEVVLPTALRTISSSAFKQSGLESVIFPSGLRKIGNEAFAETKLNDVLWPGSVPVIEDNMFKDCSSLTKILLPKNVISMGEWAFDTGRTTAVYNTSGETIVAGDSLKAVGAQYLAANTTLNVYGALTIDAALSGKLSLEGIQEIKGQNIYYTGDILLKPSAGYIIEKLQLDGRSIYPVAGEYTFTMPSSASVLTGSITAIPPKPPTPPNPPAPPDNISPPAGGTEDSGGQIPPTGPPGGNDQGTSEESKPQKKGTKITDKSSKAVYKVTSSSGTLRVEYVSSTEKKPKTIKIPSKIKSQGIWYQVTSIGKKALKGKTKLTKVTLPTTLTSIGDDAFNGCKELKAVTIPKKVTKIGKQAFYGAKKLKTVQIKSTVLKSVGKNAFKNIDKKAQIKVPKKQYSKYQKLLKGKGILSSMKWKKM